jgi:cytochrome c oxidase subunit IV
MSEGAHPTHKVYYTVFGALVVGTALTWAIAFVPLGVWNPIVALIIACTKATLVVLFFMHVRYSSKQIMLTVAIGFFWLLIMITLDLSDYLSRGIVKPQ